MIPTFKEFLLTEGSAKLDKALKLYLDKWYSEGYDEETAEHPPEPIEETVFKKGDKIRVKASAMSKFKTDRQGFNNISNPIFTVVSGPKRGYISARRAGKLDDLPVDDVELLSVNEARSIGDPNFFLPNGVKWADFKPGVKISFYFGGTNKAEAEITKVDGNGKSTKVTAKIYRTNGRRIYDPKPEKLTLTDLSNIYDITFKR